MSDLGILFFLVCAFTACVAAFLAWLLRHRAGLAWRRVLELASVNPYEPRATLLQSADGSITLARLRSGQLRSLKRKPRGKSVRKQWKRMRRALRGPFAVHASQS